MELLLLGLVVVSSLLGIGFGARSDRRIVRLLTWTGLSCFFLGIAAFVAVVVGVPLPAHPYLMGLLVFLLLVVAGALLPFGLVGMWKTRNRSH